MTAPLLGRQEPTFLWVPPHVSTLGPEVCDLSAAAGLHLLPWERLVIDGGFSTGVGGVWTCFEVGLLVSRQNGKGSILQAAELAWLFLFGERLVMHSAHLFETSREHFLRMQALIEGHADFSRRVRRMREGRGAEEIELIDGARLKFMTRKGGAGRGFTGSKLVMDEAMILDAAMMGAGLPTLATRHLDAQVWYAGSAGTKTSTQLALVRKRGYTEDEPALMLAEWAIDERPVDEGGDDRSLPETHAKANPSYGYLISADYIEKEARALGGYDSFEFGKERLGVGDWPDEDEAWEVIDEESWLGAGRPDELILAGARVAFAADTDPLSMVSTVAACARIAHTGQLLIYIVERRRGTAWLPEWLADFNALFDVCANVLLKANEAGAVIEPLENRKLPVRSPTEVEYTQACGRLKLGVEGRTTVHVAQNMLRRSVAGGRKSETREGGWRWSRKAPVSASPAIAATCAAWGFERFEKAEPVPFALTMADVTATAAPAALPTTEVQRLQRGAGGFAAARRAP